MSTDPVITRQSRTDLFTQVECEQILEEVLRGNGNGSVTSKVGKLLDFEVVPELDSIGYLGEYYHLNLHYQLENETNALKLRLFVKSMPYLCANKNIFLELSKFLKKESTLYKTLLNSLRTFSKNVWCAQCYFVKPELFVMQNIRDLGYEPTQDPRRFLSESEITAILQGLATMHASSIAYELKYQVNIGEKLKDVLNEFTVSPKVQWYTAGIRAVIAVAALHPSYQSESAKLFIKEELPPLLDTVYEMVNPSKKYRNVFCHRDPWGGNVFFSKGETKNVGAMFVDFQLCRYSPPAIDVLMATYLNTEHKVRKTIFESCCHSYYKHFTVELTEMGVDPNEQMSLLDFNNSMRDLALFGSVYNAVAATILRVPGDYLKDMKNNRPDDFHCYTNVDRTKEVLQLITSHEEFRGYMFDCIDDLMSLALTL